MRGNSRQTDLKQPNSTRVARFCHAPRLLSVTCKPRFKGSEAAMSLVRLDLCHAGAIIGAGFSAGVWRAAFGHVGGGRLIELAVER